VQPPAIARDLAATLPTVHFSPTEPPHRDDPPYGEMLRHGVSWCPEMGVVLVATHRLVVEVLDDPITYSSAYAIGPALATGKSLAVQAVLRLLPAQPPVVVNADAPAHGRQRRIFAQCVTDARIASRLPLMSRRAAELVDALRADGRAELHRGYAMPYFATVVNDLFGVPPEDGMLIDVYCVAVRLLLNPATPEDDQFYAATVLVDAYDHLAGLLRERSSADPREDLISDLTRGCSADRLTEAEQFYDLLLSRITAEEPARYLLLDAVDLMVRQRLWTRARAADPVARGRLLDQVISETLRSCGPQRGVLRVTTRPATLGGYDLPTDTPLLVAIGAANVDASTFPVPTAVDLHRPNVDEHVAFGHGPHRCLGDRLARTAVRAALAALLTLPDVQLADPRRRQRVASPAFTGLQELAVVWQA
jgi:cytochrome P450